MRYDEGSKEDILRSQRALATDVKDQAKKIATKYIDPPGTTNFGMMFVPTESLYAEILRIPGSGRGEAEVQYYVDLPIYSTSDVVGAFDGLSDGGYREAFSGGVEFTGCGKGTVWQVWFAIRGN